MSAIGVMFAPHHEVVADELVRVCRPGGTIGLLNWTPEGMIGALFRMMGPFAPPPPPGAQPPPLWGGEDHLRGLLGDRVELTLAAPRRARGHRVRAPARLRRALQGSLRPDDRAAATPSAPAAGSSSTPRWTASATTGTVGTAPARGSRWSTCSPSVRGITTPRRSCGRPPRQPPRASAPRASRRCARCASRRSWARGAVDRRCGGSCGRQRAGRPPRARGR